MKGDEELNLVPMIDMVTNLMFFLMMFASVLPVVMIDAPLPKIASTAEEVKKANNKNNNFEITVDITKNGFTVKTSGAGSKSFALAGNQYPYKELHQFLVQLHQRKVNTKEVTLMPADDVPYDVMVQVMDEARELRQGDAGYQPIPADIISKPESMQFNRLFPDVSIGGV
jgi:biopolymer transport protein ExbD